MHNTKRKLPDDEVESGPNSPCTQRTEGEITPKHKHRQAFDPLFGCTPNELPAQSPLCWHPNFNKGLLVELPNAASSPHFPNNNAFTSNSQRDDNERLVGGETTFECNLFNEGGHLLFQLPTIANSLRRQPSNNRASRQSPKDVVGGRIDTASAMQLAELLVSEERSVAKRVAQLNNDLALSQKMLEEFIARLIPLTVDASGPQRLTAENVTEILQAVFKRINVEDSLEPVYQAVILLLTMEKPYPLYNVWNRPLHEASKGMPIRLEHKKAVMPLTALLCLALASLPDEDRVFTTVTRGETVKSEEDPRWLYFLSEAHDDPYIVCAPMSTSLRHEVAEDLASRASRSLFLTVVGFGFKINKYSFYPREDEVLIPPLSAYDVSTKRQMSSHGELRLWVTMQPCITRLEPTRRLAQVIRIALLEHLLDECEARGLQKKTELEPTDEVRSIDCIRRGISSTCDVFVVQTKSQKYRMRKRLCRDSGTLISSMRELQAMMQCSNNPYFVRLLGANAGVVQPCGDRLRTLQSDDDFSWIEVTVFEEYCASTAADILQTATLGDALLFLLCVSSALQYLHDVCRIAHRNVRLRNVFIRDNCFVLSSMGYACVIPKHDESSVPDSYEEIEVTAPPDYFCFGAKSAFALDVFALCTCFASMVARKTTHFCRDETIGILKRNGLMELAAEFQKISVGAGGVPSAGVLARLAVGALRVLNHK